jgi:hypothetical protein
MGAHTASSFPRGHSIRGRPPSPMSTPIRFLHCSAGVENDHNAQFARIDDGNLSDRFVVVVPANEGHHRSYLATRCSFPSLCTGGRSSVEEGASGGRDLTHSPIRQVVVLPVFLGGLAPRATIRASLAALSRTHSRSAETSNSTSTTSRVKLHSQFSACGGSFPLMGTPVSRHRPRTRHNGRLRSARAVKISTPRDALRSTENVCAQPRKSPSIRLKTK